jgi:hypothetical protein
MARDVTVKLSTGEVLVYKGVPKNVSPEEIEAKAKADGGGADVVEINGGAPTPAAPASNNGATANDAAPAEAAPAEAAAPDTAGFEKQLGSYYAGLGGKPLDTSAIGNLAQKYHVGTPTNLAEVEEFYKKHGTLNPALQMTGPAAPPPPKEDPTKVVRTVPLAGDNTQRARAFGKGLLFDFNDELEAAGRMLASGEISSDEYYRIKEQINSDYGTWSKANPGEALGFEVAGGVAGAFIPGIGEIGTGMKAARGSEALGSTLLAGAKSGAITGALSGLGQSNTLAPSDIIPSVAMNTVIGGGAGAGFGKLAELGGRGFAAGRDAVLRRLGRTGEGADAVERQAAEILYGTTPSPERAVGSTAVSGHYDVPAPLGLVNPELAALTEKVLAKPSAGREGLATTLAETQAEAGTRVGQQVEKGLPGPQDYFDAEDAITKNLRKIGDTEYQKAFAVGSVNDPQLIAIANNPELSSIWAKAQRLARLEGRDLPTKMEPVLDASGALVGLKPTKDLIPDVQSLHYLKRALDDTIDAGFRGNAGVGKAEASVLRDSIRKPLVERLDALVPEYAKARALYAGDLEVRDALRLGRDLLKNKMRPQQLQRSMKDMSDAEREALRTGARQSIFEPLEDATTNRNFAQRLRGVRGDSATLQKLQMVMDPAEFKFFNRALQREDDLFKRGSRVMGGSRTAPLAEGMAALDNMIGQNDIPAAVNFIMSGNPGRIASFARWVSNLNPGKEFGDKVYTKLSQVLSANDPAKLREVLDMLARSKSYSQYMAKVKDVATGPVAGIAGNVVPSAFEDRSAMTPPTMKTGEDAAVPDDVMEQARRAVEQPVGDENAGLQFQGAAEDGTVPFSGKSVGERNANRGNIIDNAWARGQPGYAGPGENGFARFKTTEAGDAAQHRLIAGKIRRGENTPDALVDSYLGGDPRNTPESTANYKTYVAKRLGIGIGDRIPLNLIKRASQAMIEFETGAQVQ